MNYHHYYPVDMVNGTGTRCTLFVSGCEHYCKGCYNSSTWPVNSGRPFTDELEDQIIADLRDEKIVRNGLSLTGGDPLLHHNLAVVQRLVSRVKRQCPDKTIWLWTGYQLEALCKNQKAVLPYIDVLIDGRFESEQRDSTLRWRGSRNQKVIILPAQAEISDPVSSPV